METSSLFEVIYAEAPARPWRGIGRTSRKEGTPPNWPHLAWPDKVGLVAALVIAVLSAFVCATLLLAADTMTFGRLNHLLAMWSGAAELIIALPIWLLMRGIDFAIDGPAHRRAGRKFRIEE